MNFSAALPLVTALGSALLGSDPVPSMHRMEHAAAPAVIVTGPSATMTREFPKTGPRVVYVAPPRQRFGKLRALLRGQPIPPSNATAFTRDGVRHEPHLRDDRLLSGSRTLVGNDMGRRESLPVLPAREDGYFLLTPDQR